MARPCNPFDLDDAVKRYQAGEPIQKLADQLHVARRTLVRGLELAGVKVRSRSDAYRLWWQSATAPIKARRLRNFTESQRGVRRSLTARTKQASSHAGRTRGRDEPLHEADLLAKLAAVGLAALHQHPIGPYTVDLALKERRVAIEVQRANWTLNVKRGKSLFRERLEHILDSGWSLLVVYCPPSRTGEYRRLAGSRKKFIAPPKPRRCVERFDGAAVAYKIIALLNVPGAFPASGGQHGVIDGYGKPSAIVRLKLHNRPAIPGL